MIKSYFSSLSISGLLMLSVLAMVMTTVMTTEVYADKPHPKVKIYAPVSGEGTTYTQGCGGEDPETGDYDYNVQHCNQIVKEASPYGAGANKHNRIVCEEYNQEECKQVNPNNPK